MARSKRMEASMAAQQFTASRRILGISAIAFVCIAALGGAATASAAPRNDNFGNAATLRVGKAVKGTISGATNQHGEPRHANSLATHSVWYKLRARSRVGVLLGTCSANFDSVVAVYSGGRLSGLREVDFNNDGCGRSSGGSRVSFTAKKGKTYHIAVAGFAASGRFRLTVDRIFTPLNDDLADAVALTPGSGLSASTRNATRELREPAHADNQPHTVWFKLGLPAGGPVTVNACNGSFPTLTVYTGSTMRTLTRFATEDNCRVTFTAAPGTTYRIVAEDGGSGGSFRISS
jgi:hypothetical protein